MSLILSIFSDGLLFLCNWDHLHRYVRLYCFRYHYQIQKKKSLKWMFSSLVCNPIFFPLGADVLSNLTYVLAIWFYSINFVITKFALFNTKKSEAKNNTRYEISLLFLAIVMKLALNTNSCKMVSSLWTTWILTILQNAVPLKGYGRKGLCF